MKLELVIDMVARPWQPEAELIEWLQAYVDSIGPRDGRLLVIVSDDRTVREHNRDYRGLDKPTDVLSFSYLGGHEAARLELLQGSPARPYCDTDTADGSTSLVGQVLISIETLRARGPQHADDIDGEVMFLTTHGLLHVLGFDHEREQDAAEMESLELELFEPMRRRLCERKESGPA